MANEKPDIRPNAVLPRLPVFSGDAKDVPYEQWQFEVQCLQRERWSEEDLKLLIRRSVKGQAASTLVNLGIDASVAQVLAKFENVFGSGVAASTVMAKFFSLKQAEGETAGVFARRIEETAHLAVKLGRIKPGELDSSLKEVFACGLRTAVKAAAGFLFEMRSLSFDELVTEVRRREQELGLDQAAKVNALQKSEVDDLKAQVASLTQELKALKTSQTATYSQPRGPFAAPQAFRQKQASRRRAETAREPRQPVICHRCHQVGHIARGCRNYVPSNHLNEHTPVRAGNSQVPLVQPSWENPQ